jgi:radical SAM superfamily enzyme YgiQ (UPF0313 family)
MDGKNVPRALFVYPPVYDFALYDLFLKPYGLLRIAGWLLGGGWDVSFVNALDYDDPPSAGILGPAKRRENGTGKFFRRILPPPPGLRSFRRQYARYGIIPESFRLRLKEAAGKGGPDLVLVSSGMTYWYPGVAEAVRFCRELFPRTPVAVGGVYATLMPRHCAASSEADNVISGEAWGPLAAVLNRLGLPVPSASASREPLDIGTVFRDAGTVRLNSGCPFSCDYCASRVLSPRFSSGDPESAFQAVKALCERRGTLSFALYDDALLVDKDRVLHPFLEKIIEHFGGKLRFYLPNAVHIRYIDSKTAGLMRAAGFQDVRMGFESSSPDFHALHDDKFGDGSLPSAVDALLGAGFKPEALSVYILAGLPGQRVEETEESVRYAAASNVRVRIAEYSPVPGTALWAQSVHRCRYPIEEEPLYHNNTILPLEWEGFTQNDLDRIKILARSFDIRRP